MILDDLIALVFSVVALVFAAITTVVSAVINLIALVIEGAVCLVFSGFRLGRVEPPVFGSNASSATPGGIVSILLTVALFAAFLIVPFVINRKVTLVAKDGHSLPFAAVIIETGGGSKQERTSSSGHIQIPRFGTKSVTVKDSRYVEQTWSAEEIESELIVSRTILGSSLDILADKLLKPAAE